MIATDTATYTPKQLKAAQRVLDTLDRWDERLNGDHAKHRKHSRNPFRSMVTVLVPPAS